MGTEHLTPEKKGTQQRITREQAPLLPTPSLFSEKNKRSTGRGNLPLRAERNLKAPASWPLPIICGYYSM